MADSNVFEDALGSPGGYAIEANVEMDEVSGAKPVETVTIEGMEPISTLDSKTLPFFTSHAGHPTREHAQYEVSNEHAVNKRHLAVVAPPIERPWEYRVYEEPQVIEILEEYDGGGLAECLVQLDDGSEEVVCECFPLHSPLVRTTCCSEPKISISPQTFQHHSFLSPNPFLCPHFPHFAIVRSGFL